jgi:hypothetical protein
MKVSKSLQEVWRWKEEVARDTEGMSVQELLDYFSKSAERLEKKTGKKLDLPRATTTSGSRFVERQ